MRSTNVVRTASHPWDSSWKALYQGPLGDAPSRRGAAASHRASRSDRAKRIECGISRIDEGVPSGPECVLRSRSLFDSHHHVVPIAGPSSFCVTSLHPAGVHKGCGGWTGLVQQEASKPDEVWEAHSTCRRSVAVDGTSRPGGWVTFDRGAALRTFGRRRRCDLPCSWRTDGSKEDGKEGSEEEEGNLGRTPTGCRQAEGLWQGPLAELAPQSGRRDVDGRRVEDPSGPRPEEGASDLDRRVSVHREIARTLNPTRAGPASSPEAGPACHSASPLLCSSFFAQGVAVAGGTSSGSGRSASTRSTSVFMSWRSSPPRTCGITSTRRQNA